MIPMIKLSDGKELFFEHCDTDLSRSPVMGTHHYHKAFEIYYFVKGECKYFIDDRTYTLLPGDVILIPENVIHRTMYTSNYERKLLNFSTHFIPSSLLKEISSLPYIFRNHNVSKEIAAIFDAIEKEYTSMDVHSEEMLVSLIKALFILIARSENKALQSGGNSVFVAETIKYVSEGYQGDISLNGIAALFSVSPEHFSRTFKKETGFGFNEYLTLVRLQKAEQFLSDGRFKNISEVAYACGFNDSNYFSERFKKFYGVSPMKFKKTPKAIEKAKKV